MDLSHTHPMYGQQLTNTAGPLSRPQNGPFPNHTPYLTNPQWAQVNHPAAQVNHPGAQVNHLGAQVNHPTAQMNHPGAQVNHPRAQLNHPTAQMNHPGAQVNHPGAQVNHPGAQVNHPGAQVNHSGAQMNLSEAQINHSGAQINHTRAQMSHPGAHPGFQQKLPVFQQKQQGSRQSSQGTETQLVHPAHPGTTHTLGMQQNMGNHPMGQQYTDGAQQMNMRPDQPKQQPLVNLFAAQKQCSDNCFNCQHGKACEKNSPWDVQGYPTQRSNDYSGPPFKKNKNDPRPFPNGMSPSPSTWALLGKQPSSTQQQHWMENMANHQGRGLQKMWDSQKQHWRENMAMHNSNKIPPSHRPNVSQHLGSVPHGSTQVQHMPEIPQQHVGPQDTGQEEKMMSSIKGIIDNVRKAALESQNSNKVPAQNSFNGSFQMISKESNKVISTGSTSDLTHPFNSLYGLKNEFVKTKVEKEVKDDVASFLMSSEHLTKDVVSTIPRLPPAHATPPRSPRSPRVGSPRVRNESPHCNTVGVSNESALSSFTTTNGPVIKNEENMSSNPASTLPVEQRPNPLHRANPQFNMENMMAKIERMVNPAFSNAQPDAPSGTVSLPSNNTHDLENSKTGPMPNFTKEDFQHKMKGGPNGLLQMKEERPVAEEPVMLEGENPELFERLKNNTVIEVPECGCIGTQAFSESSDGPYYTHLGSAPSVQVLREIMEDRWGVKGEAVRIEKVIYTGKEGKSSRGCPIAKWIIRRSGPEEKVLVICKHRTGHYCASAVIVINIVLWEGVPGDSADDLYSHLVRVLPAFGHETERRCGTNEERTCACQGWSEDRRGASFSFGCSWSMYYNGCKFARSRVVRKIKLKDEKEEGPTEDRLQNLATHLAPLYKQMAPAAYNNQCRFENQAVECRLGKNPGRPFSGVTACVDFCAHAHKDIHNMNNGSTVVVTLTKHRGFSKPDDEQLHVLPLYVLDPNGETGDGRLTQERLTKGGLDCLTKYQVQMRVRAVPLTPCKQRTKLAKMKGSPRRRRASWGGDQSPAYHSQNIGMQVAKEKVKNAKKPRKLFNSVHTPNAKLRARLKARKDMMANEIEQEQRRQLVEWQANMGLRPMYPNVIHSPQRGPFNQHMGYPPQSFYGQGMPPGYAWPPNIDPNSGQQYPPGFGQHLQMMANRMQHPYQQHQMQQYQARMQQWQHQQQFQQRQQHPHGMDTMHRPQAFEHKMQRPQSAGHPMKNPQSFEHPMMRPHSTEGPFQRPQSTGQHMMRPHSRNEQRPSSIDPSLQKPHHMDHSAQRPLSTQSADQELQRPNSVDHSMHRPHSAQPSQQQLQRPASVDRPLQRLQQTVENQMNETNSMDSLNNRPHSSQVVNQQMPRPHSLDQPIYRPQSTHADQLVQNPGSGDQSMKRDHPVQNVNHQINRSISIDSSHPSDQQKSEGHSMHAVNQQMSRPEPVNPKQSPNSSQSVDQHLQIPRSVCSSMLSEHSVQHQMQMPGSEPQSMHQPLSSQSVVLPSHPNSTLPVDHQIAQPGSEQPLQRSPSNEQHLQTVEQHQPPAPKEYSRLQTEQQLLERARFTGNENQSSRPGHFRQTDCPTPNLSAENANARSDVPPNTSIIPTSVNPDIAEAMPQDVSKSHAKSPASDSNTFPKPMTESPQEHQHISSNPPSYEEHIRNIMARVQQEDSKKESVGKGAFPGHSQQKTIATSNIEIKQEPGIQTPSNEHGLQNQQSGFHAPRFSAPKNEFQSEQWPQHGPPTQAVHHHHHQVLANTANNKENISAGPLPTMEGDPAYLPQTMEEGQADQLTGNEPNDYEYASDSEEVFKDRTVGGVAIALTHGSVLFECAKRELHATTALKNPNRHHPTRVSLVFYQHKKMNNRHHGLYEHERKMEEIKQKRLKEQLMKGQPGKEQVGAALPAENLVKRNANGEIVKKKKKFKPPVYRYMWPTALKRSDTRTTNTMHTRWIQPKTTVTGPYQKWV